MRPVQNSRHFISIRCYHSLFSPPQPPFQYKSLFSLISTTKQVYSSWLKLKHRLRFRVRRKADRHRTYGLVHRGASRSRVSLAIKTFVNPLIIYITPYFPYATALSEFVLIVVIPPFSVDLLTAIPNPQSHADS